MANFDDLDAIFEGVGAAPAPASGDGAAPSASSAALTPLDDLFAELDLLTGTAAAAGPDAGAVTADRPPSPPPPPHRDDTPAAAAAADSTAPMVARVPSPKPAASEVAAKATPPPAAAATVPAVPSSTAAGTASVAISAGESTAATDVEPPPTAIAATPAATGAAKRSSPSPPAAPARTSEVPWEWSLDDLDDMALALHDNYEAQLQHRLALEHAAAPVAGQVHQSTLAAAPAVSGDDVSAGGAASLLAMIADEEEEDGGAHPPGELAGDGSGGAAAAAAGTAEAAADGGNVVSVAPLPSAAEIDLVVRIAMAKRNLTRVGPLERGSGTPAAAVAAGPEDDTHRRHRMRALALRPRVWLALLASCTQPLAALLVGDAAAGDADAEVRATLPDETMVRGEVLRALHADWIVKDGEESTAAAAGDGEAGAALLAGCKLPLPAWQRIIRTALLLVVRLHHAAAAAAAAAEDSDDSGRAAASSGDGGFEGIGFASVLADCCSMLGVVVHVAAAATVAGISPGRSTGVSVDDASQAAAHRAVFTAHVTYFLHAWLALMCAGRPAHTLPRQQSPSEVFEAMLHGTLRYVRPALVAHLDTVYPGWCLSDNCEYIPPPPAAAAATSGDSAASDAPAPAPAALTVALRGCVPRTWSSGAFLVGWRASHPPAAAVVAAALGPHAAATRGLPSALHTAASAPRLQRPSSAAVLQSATAAAVPVGIDDTHPLLQWWDHVLLTFASRVAPLPAPLGDAAVASLSLSHGLHVLSSHRALMLPTVLMAASLVLQEERALSVIGVRRPPAAGAPDLVPAPASAHSYAASSYLFRLTFDGALQRALKLVHAVEVDVGALGGGGAVQPPPPLLDWVAHTRTHVQLVLPGSALHSMARWASSGTLANSAATANCVAGKAAPLYEPDADTLPRFLPQVSAEEVAVQLLYGWAAVTSHASLPLDSAAARSFAETKQWLPGADYAADADALAHQAQAETAAAAGGGAAERHTPSQGHDEPSHASGTAPRVSMAAFLSAFTSAASGGVANVRQRWLRPRRRRTSAAGGHEGGGSDDDTIAHESGLDGPITVLIPGATRRHYLRRPSRLLLIDVRPIAHRGAGRLSVAFHVDPRTCLPVPATVADVPSAPPPAAASTIGAMPEGSATTTAPALAAASAPASSPSPAADGEIVVTVASAAAASGEAIGAAAADLPASATATAATDGDDALATPADSSSSAADAATPSSSAPEADASQAAIAGEATSSAPRAVSSHSDGSGGGSVPPAATPQPSLATEPSSSSMSHVGIPLAEAAAQLAALSSAQPDLHFVVAGVGVASVPAAYKGAVLAAQAQLDDERVAAVMEALAAAGCAHVSVLPQGFAAIHAALRQPQLLPDLAGPTPAATAASSRVSGGSSRATPLHTAAHRIVIMEHVPRKCVCCRHAAITRVLDAAARHETAASGGGDPSTAHSTTHMRERFVQLVRDDLQFASHSLQVGASAVAAGGSEAMRRLQGVLATLAPRGGGGESSGPDGEAPGGGMAAPAPALQPRAAGVAPGTLAASASLVGQRAYAALFGGAAHDGAGRDGKATAGDAAAPAVPAVATSPGSEGLAGGVAPAPAAAANAAAVRPPVPAAAAASSSAASVQARLRSAASAASATLASVGRVALAAPPPGGVEAVQVPALRAGRKSSVAEGTADGGGRRGSAGSVASSGRASPSAAPPVAGGVPAPAAPSAADSAPSAGAAVRLPAPRTATPAPAPTSSAASSTAAAAAQLAGRMSRGFASLSSSLATSTSSLWGSGAATRSPASAGSGGGASAAAGAPAPVGSAKASSATRVGAGAATAAPHPPDPAEALRGLQLAGLRKGDDFDLSVWSAHTRLFRCTKTKASRPAADAGDEMVEVLPRYLCVARERLLVVAAHPSRLGHGIVKSNHHISEIAKLTFSRRTPSAITLHYRRAAAAAADGSGGTVAAAVTVERSYDLGEAAADFREALQRIVTAIQPVT